MKYIRKFSSESEYLNFKETANFILPNVSLIADSDFVMYNEYVEPPISLCDIAYWDGNNIKTIAKDKWSSSLGTPIGVVVIPSGMLPDGKARMIGLNPVDSNGNASTSHVPITWGGYGTDTSLTNYKKVIVTDNNGSTTDSRDYGWLPSDKLTGDQSFVDAKAKYDASSNFIPSPYLGDDKTLNPDYYSEYINGHNNALSDFNGLSNTQTLVGLGSDYVAANAAWKYSDGVSSTQWYLPGMGELGFLMARFNAINEVISEVGGIEVEGNNFFWSSSEYNKYKVYLFYSYDGAVDFYSKDYKRSVRPFGLL